MRKIMFGDMVDYLRKDRGLTMAELGDKVGRTKSTISTWISGNRSPKLEEIVKLADFFNVSLEVLIFGGDAKEKER